MMLIKIKNLFKKNKCTIKLQSTKDLGKINNALQTSLEPIKCITETKKSIHISIDSKQCSVGTINLNNGRIIVNGNAFIINAQESQIAVNGSCYKATSNKEIMAGKLTFEQAILEIKNGNTVHSSDNPTKLINKNNWKKKLNNKDLYRDNWSIYEQSQGESLLVN